MEQGNAGWAGWWALTVFQKLQNEKCFGPRVQRGECRAGREAKEN